MRWPDILRVTLFSLLLAPTAAISQDYVIRNVTVIDGTGKPAKPSMSVVVINRRIAEVVPASQESRHPGIRVIDGSGRFLIPGLWDAHVHLVDIDEAAIPILVTYGVTSVRDMGGDIDRIKDWRRRIANGTLIGPRIEFCGPMLEGDWEQKPGARKDHWAVTTPEAARATVDKLAAAGVDCIKMRGYKSPETYFALASEAKRVGLPLYGHAPWGVDPIAASDAGQKSFEHAFYPWPWDKLSAEEKERVEDHFRKNGSLLVPTLIAWQSFLLPGATIDAAVHDTEGKSDPRQLSVTPALRRNWISGAADIKKMVRGDQALPGWRKAMEASYAQIQEMHDHGVGVMAGTDTGSTLVFPGDALHRELGLLVHQCHFTPMEALLTATIIPAKSLGVEDRLGTVAPGKMADLVLLHANPLDDISNLGAIDGVMLDGRWFDESELKQIVIQSEHKIRAEYKRDQEFAAPR